MKKLTTLLAATALAVIPVLPGAAQTDGPLRLQPCESSNTALTFDGDAFTAEMPLLSGDVTAVYTLDLSGQEVDADEDMDDTARVRTSSSWAVVANDYDLGVNGTLSEGLQPLDPAEESVNLNNVAHCSTVFVSVINYTATGGDTVDVEILVS